MHVTWRSSCSGQFSNRRPRHLQPRLQPLRLLRTKETFVFVGLRSVTAIKTSFMWGPIFAFAYARPPFGGSARGCALGFAGAWFATVAFFVLLTVWETTRVRLSAFQPLLTLTPPSACVPI